ncbi:Phosphoglycerate kinase, c-terminal, partial [Globisporangium splendens]
MPLRSLAERQNGLYIDEQRVGTDEQQILDHIESVMLQREMQRRRTVHVLTKSRVRTHCICFLSSIVPHYRSCVDVGVREEQRLEDLTVALAFQGKAGERRKEEENESRVGSRPTACSFAEPLREDKPTAREMNGSPSMANSSASKRTRTIVVARSIPSDASEPSGATEANRSSAAVLDRRKSNGKLPTYAALGSAEDVDIYEKYLADQQQGDSRPSPSELRTGGGTNNNSPQHLKVSMKRKTSSQLGIDNNESTHSGSSNGKASESTESTTKSLHMQLEMVEGDAKKRREALVAQRKWLRSLPIHERLAQQRQQNVLKHWQQINQDWERFKARTSKKLGKRETDLVMTRASKYREQVEMYDVLQKAAPLSEKVGSDMWLVSLRDDGTRYVSVGNIFSGLFYPIRETLARDARKEETPPEKAAPGTPPHEVALSESSHLSIETMDLFEWVSGSGNDTRKTSSIVPTEPLELSLLSQVPEDTSRRSDASMRLSGHGGPSFRISVVDSVASLDPTLDDVPEEKNQLPTLLCLDFYGDVQQQQQRCIVFENDGTTVLHFEWTRKAFDDDDNILTSRLRHAQSPQEQAQTAHFTKTCVSQTQGSVLPGDAVEFTFTFISDRPGVFLEKWLLDVDPPAFMTKSMSVNGSIDSSSSNNQYAEQSSVRSPRPVTSPGLSTSPPSSLLAVEVHLYCTAADNFIPRQRHLTQKSQLERKQTVFMVEQLVEDVLKQVNPKPKVGFPGLDDAATAFYALNQRDFGDVYYSDAFVRRCHELYIQAHAALASSDLPAAGSGDSAELKTSECNDASEAVAPAAPESVATLREIARAADAQSTAELKNLSMELQRVLEQEEEEDDEEEDEGEDEDEDEDEDEEDEDEDGGTDKEQSKKAIVKEVKETRAARRERLANERRGKCVQLQLQIDSLRPRYEDIFHCQLYLPACTAPHTASMLSARLAMGIASLCSEVPVIHEIARVQCVSSGDVRANTETGVAKVLTRAIDEAVADEMDYQETYEHARRGFHQKVESPVSGADQSGIDGAATNLVANQAQFSWRFSRELLNRDEFIPGKVTNVAHSLNLLLELIREHEVPMSAVVLVSDLSMPPLTKPMRRQLLKVLSTRAANGSESQPSLAQVLVSMASDLTLRPIAQLLERVLDQLIAFCGSLAEVEENVNVLRATGDASDADTDAASACEVDEPGTSPRTVSTRSSTPKIFLVENLRTLVGSALEAARTSDPEVNSKPVMPSPAPVPEPKAVAAVPAAAGKKSVAAVPARGSVVALQPPIAAAATAPPEPAPVLEETKPKSGLLSAANPDRLQLQVEALASKLAPLADVCVIDTFLLSPWENPFTAPSLKTDEKETEKVKKFMLAGPQLLYKVDTWAQILQQPATSRDKLHPRHVTAIVGGKDLQSKLRIIDNLLEVVDAIYFVGEIALSLYRVLFTKHDDMRRRWRQLPERSPMSLWSVLVPAIERLKQKAHHKCVKLYLSVDWIVGDVTLEEQDTLSNGTDEDDEEEEEEEEAEEDQEDDGEDDKKTRKKSKKAAKQSKKPKKPIVEPEEIDSWSKQWSYEGEKAHVAMEKCLQWQLVSDVDHSIFTKWKVLSGNANVLVSKRNEDAEDENDDEDNPEAQPESEGTKATAAASTSNTPVKVYALDNPTAFEFEWTF